MVTFKEQNFFVKEFRTYFLQNVLHGAQEILTYHVAKLLPNSDRNEPLYCSLDLVFKTK